MRSPGNANGDSNANLYRWLRLRHVRELLAVADARSVSRAAADLGISQPALSKSLAEVEKLFGGKIFHRSSQGLVATDFGAVVLQHCRTIDSELQRASVSIATYPSASLGHVTFGIYMVAQSELIPAALAKLRATRQHIRCKILSADTEILENSLIAGDVDFIVGRPPSFRHSRIFNHEVLFHEKLCVVGGPAHPLAGSHTIDPAGLAEYPWILPHPSSAAYASLTAMFASHGLRIPASYLECASLSLIKTLLQDNSTLVALPVGCVRHDVQRGELTLLPIAMEQGDISVGITSFAGREQSTAGNQVLECIRSVAAASGMP